MQSAVFDLWESAGSRTSKLQQEMSYMQASTSTVKAEWTTRMEKTETQYMENTSAVELGKKELEVVLEEWYSPSDRDFSFLLVFSVMEGIIKIMEISVWRRQN